jgi:protein arginine kinase
MTLFPHNPSRSSPWLCDAGPQGDVVLSSRVRLARNLAGYPFLGRASVVQRRELLRNCKARILESDLGSAVRWIELADAPPLDRQLLVERHLISRQHSQGAAPRGLALSEDESVAIMVNEEDHLRLQVLRAGLHLEDAYQQADRIDNGLEARMDFAFSPRLGYLTACPTNVGTGIRVSVMLHLPALKLTGEIDKLRRACKDMHLAVRGFFGEGTEPLGDLYQISNQTTLGRDERQILHDFQSAVIPQMIEYERRARQALVDQRATLLDDRVFRAWGTLTTARLLTGDEAMALLSTLRLGVTLRRIDRVALSTVNELMLVTQPAHLQRIANQPLEAPARHELRATFVRQRLGA